MPIVRVELLPGRSPEQKAQYAKRVTELAVDILGCPLEAVDVLFIEVQGHDWARAGVPCASSAAKSPPEITRQ
ncbi:tautomerase family protein [Stutzerimonas chloritidismutans]|uniref:tautomerase family protein n=1 Tax=Stutzerimonas chloritidismutans TaxID=203192 RepID=UPI003F1748FA